MTRKRSGSSESVRLTALAGLVAAVVLGVAIGGRPALEASGLWVDGGEATVSPTLFAPAASPSPSGPPSAPAAAGGASAQAAGNGRAVNPSALARALNAVPAKGFGTITGTVVDLETNTVLYDRAAASPQVPASTNKLLTCLAALDALGSETRFETQVRQPSAGVIVLVGGGDPYLASVGGKFPHPSTSAQLAASTAVALKKQGRTSVQLAYDDSLFTGPAWHADWPNRFHEQVATISALWIDQGRTTEKGMPGANPSPHAAGVFAAQLKAQGITVTGAATKAVASGETIATVQSLPVRTIVQEALTHSDNSATEVLLRHVGSLDRKDASFAGGVAAVHARLAALGVDLKGVSTTDGSGLSDKNRIPARTLASVLRVASQQPRLRGLVEGLPAAGVNGTLQLRYYQPATEAGRGWVRAKSGNLNKVSTLAGVTRTRNGRQVAFAFMSNNAEQEWAVRSYLDELTAVVAGCNC